MEIHEGRVLNEGAAELWLGIDETGEFGDLPDSIELAWRQLEAILAQPDHQDVDGIRHPSGAVCPWWLYKFDGCGVSLSKLGDGVCIHVHEKERRERERVRLGGTSGDAVTQEVAPHFRFPESIFHFREQNRKWPEVGIRNFT